MFYSSTSLFADRDSEDSDDEVVCIFDDTWTASRLVAPGAAGSSVGHELDVEELTRELSRANDGLAFNRHVIATKNTELEQTKQLYERELARTQQLQAEVQELNGEKEKLERKRKKAKFDRGQLSLELDQKIAELDKLKKA